MRRHDPARPTAHRTPRPLGAAGERQPTHHPLPIDPDLDPDDQAEPSSDHRPGRGRSHRARPMVLAAIIAGGAIGTWGRYEVGSSWVTPPGQVPWATFVINTTGAFLLGFVLGWLLGRRHPSPLLRAFAATGVLGGWTTYSTLAVETVALGKSHRFGPAGAYVGASLAAGLVAVAVGLALGRATTTLASPSRTTEGALSVTGGQDAAGTIGEGAP